MVSIDIYSGFVVVLHCNGWIFTVARWFTHYEAFNKQLEVPGFRAFLSLVNVRSWFLILESRNRVFQPTTIFYWDFWRKPCNLHPKFRWVAFAIPWRCHAPCGPTHLKHGDMWHQPCGGLRNVWEVLLAFLSLMISDSDEWWWLMLMVIMTVMIVMN